MLNRLVAFALLFTATACASANLKGTGGPSVTVKNESTTTIDLYVTESEVNQAWRQLTKLGPSETYRYRGPVPSSLQHNLSFFALPDIGTTRREVSGSWSTVPGPSGIVTCR